MTNDVLHIEPCGCRVMRDAEGCGVHIEWCAMHGEARRIFELIAAFWRGYDPAFDPAIEAAHKVLGICPHCKRDYRGFHQWDDLDKCPICQKPLGDAEKEAECK